MKRQGAEIVDNVKVSEIDEIPVAKFFCNRFKTDINAYLAKRTPAPPVKSLEEILASGKFHPSIEKRMLDAQAEAPPDDNPKCKEATDNGKRLAAGVLQAMDTAQLDALVYPSWNNPPRLIGDLNTPHGNNSPRISPPTGFPAITVPMGFVHGGTLPAGLQILLERADADQDRICLRAGDPSSPATPDHPATLAWSCRCRVLPISLQSSPAPPMASAERSPCAWPRKGPGRCWSTLTQLGWKASSPRSPAPAARSTPSPPMSPRRAGNRSGARCN